MNSLKEKLEEELKSGQPGKVWYNLFQPIVQRMAGTWPPRYFLEYDLDASNEVSWKYAKKEDLSQKLFLEQILNPARGKISFLLSAESDMQIRSNAKLIVHQFLVDITEGSDDKRAYATLKSKLAAKGLLLLSAESSFTEPVGISDQKLSEKIKRILLVCPHRLPNAFIPAGEGERESPNWSTAGYEWIADQIIELNSSISESVLRGGIADAFTHLRSSLYYLDEPNVFDTSVYASGEGSDGDEQEGGFMGISTLTSPQEAVLLKARQEIAGAVLASLSAQSRKFLSHVTISKNKSNLAISLGVSRVTTDKYATDTVKEVNHLFIQYGVDDYEAQAVRDELLKIIDPPVGYVKEE